MNPLDRKSKIPYLQCQVKSHEGESLNLVCIGCKEAGLICSLCSESHRNHRIIPLKILIHNIKNKLAEAPEDEEYCSNMQRLQNIKNNMLYQLKVCVQTVAQHFERLEQDIIDRYNEIKFQVIQQIQLGLQMEDLLHRVVAGTISQEDYLGNIKKLAKFVKPKGDKEFVLSIDFDSILKPFVVNELSLPKKMRIIEECAESQLKMQPIQVIEQKIKEKEDEGELSKLFDEKHQLHYRFSSTFKATCINLNETRAIATQSQTQSGRFVIIEEGMGLANRKIKFKIAALKNWVGLGVCLKDKIVSTKYQFKYQSMGHGSFLLSNNGYTWSHYYPEDNIHSSQFVFKEGNTVELTLDPKELIFKVNDNPIPFKLRIEYKAEEWPQVCFCANLCSQGDSVQILDQ